MKLLRHTLVLAPAEGKVKKRVVAVTIPSGTYTREFASTARYIPVFAYEGDCILVEIKDTAGRSSQKKVVKWTAGKTVLRVTAGGVKVRKAVEEFNATLPFDKPKATAKATPTPKATAKATPTPKAEPKPEPKPEPSAESEAPESSETESAESEAKEK